MTASQSDLLAKDIFFAVPQIPFSLLARNSGARLSALPHCATILHLIHVRHKNQHQHSSWYRHFSSLRRQVNLLCQDLAIPTPHLYICKTRKPSSSSRHGSKTREGKPDKRQGEQRLHFWIMADLPGKWYASFTQVVATTQHSSLGLLLLALLAKVCALTGILTTLEQQGHQYYPQMRALESAGVEVEEILQMQEGRAKPRQWLIDISQKPASAPTDSFGPSASPQKLHGVSELRKSSRKDPSSQRDHADSSLLSKKKAKRKIENHIDALFGSL